jgi:hypothetical protein
MHTVNTAYFIGSLHEGSGDVAQDYQGKKEKSTAKMTGTDAQNFRFSMVLLTQ